MALPPALTTIFTPPASCNQINIFTPGPAYVLGPFLDTVDCLPSGYNYLQTPYFSPGLQCPSGYTKACGSSNVVGTTTETVATCCPTGGYQCATRLNNGDGYSCSLRYSTNTVVAAIATSSGGTYATTASMKGGFDGVIAYSVQIRWQATDLSPSTSPTTSTNSITSSSASLTTSLAGLPTNIQPKEGLPAGAKIGIGIGIPIGVLLLGLVGVAFLRRRKRKLQVREANGQPSQEKPETVLIGRQTELQGSDRLHTELQGSDRFPEMEG